MAGRLFTVSAGSGIAPGSIRGGKVHLTLIFLLFMIPIWQNQPFLTLNSTKYNIGTGRENMGITCLPALPRQPQKWRWKHNFQVIPSKFKVHRIETEPKRHLMHPLTHNTFFYLLKTGTCGWGGRWTLVLWFSTLWVCWTIFIWNLIQCLNIPLKPFIFAFSCTAHKQPWVLRAPRRLHHQEAESWTNLGWNLPQTRRKPAIYVW